MAKKQIFKRKKERDYLAELEELLKKNKGTGLYEAFDVNPRAFRIGGRVVDPSGLGQDVMQDDIKFAPYDYSTIPMNAPNVGQVGTFSLGDLEPTEQPEQPVVQPEPTEQPEQPEQPEQLNYNTAEGFREVLSEMVAFPVSATSDGGTLYSNGTVQYPDGTSREATREDVPKIIARFDDGWAMLTNGKVVNLNNQIGRGYRGLSGLMDLLFGRQQNVNQEYGNINPIEPTKGNVNLGTDIDTTDLPQNFNFTLPFEAKVVGITYDDGTRFGSKSGHQGYGNSVLLQLPNGSMIRMAHLSDMENFSVGDIVRPFDYIGTPGQTGNATGEHLDLEYYTPEGKIAHPKEFFLDSMDYIDFKQIEDSQVGGVEKLPPEYQDWAKAQQDLISRGVKVSLDPARFQNQEQAPIQNIQQAVPQVGQRISDVAQNIAQVPQRIIQATQPMSPERQALGSIPGQIANAMDIQANLGLGAGIRGEDPVQTRISAISQQPKIYNPYRQLAGNVLETVGDVANNFFPGAKIFQEGARSEAIAGGPTVHTGQALANEIGGERPEEVPGIKQNLKDIGADIANRVTQTINPVVTKVGEGLDRLKQKTSNIYQKPSIMGLFQGQKQVGDITPGTSIIKTAGQGQGTPQPDAFFKYGGVNQYAQYLIDNAQQARGGALDTALFTPEFYQDPNKIANVFGETSQGKEATNKYKEYLKSQIKPGYDQPYRTEQKQEGDTLYEYKIPIPEYFQNQYYQNLLAETPDTLKSGFSFDQFQLPTTTKSVSEYKGQVPVKDSLTPIFKSGVVDLFRRSNSNLGQLAGNVLKSPAGVYQPSQQSARFEVPETTRSIFQIPSPSSVVIPPTSIQKTIIKQPEPVIQQPVKQPTLSDYLARGKSVAQWFAEVEGQDKLDALQRKGYDPRSNQIPDEYKNVRSIPEAQKQQSIGSGGSEAIQNVSGRTVYAAPGQKLYVDSSGEAQSVKDMGSLSTPTKTVSAQLSSSASNNQSIFSPLNWLKKLFKR